MGSGPGYALLDLCLELRPDFFWMLDSQFGAKDLSTPPLYDGTGSGVSIGGTSGGPERGAATNTCTTFSNSLIDASGFAFQNGAAMTICGLALRDTSADFDTLFSGSAAPANPAIFYLGPGSQDVVWDPQNGAGAAAATWSGAWPGNGIWVPWGLGDDRAAGQASLFLNGALVSTQAQADAFGASNTLRLGAYSAGFLPFDGKMLCVLGFKRLLSAAAHQAFAKAAVASLAAGQGAVAGGLR